MGRVNKNTIGIFFKCDNNGYVIEVIEKDDAMPYLFEVGDTFFKNVMPENLNKALDFFSKLKTSSICTDYEINFIYENKITTFLVSGAYYERDYLLIVSNTKVENQINDDLLLMNNELINFFRIKLNSLKEDKNTKVEKDFDLFNEISRLNNELTNLQRELARKNTELELLNERLEELTIRDSLTNLYNKRYMETKFIEEATRSGRFSYPISFAVIDLNNFKEINDRYGHHQGDLTLIKFADIAYKNIRKELDYIFRIGGDEFALLLTHCEEDMAISIIERIDIEYREYTVLSSLAFGITSFIGFENGNLEKIFLQTDEKMYKHKAQLKHKNE